MYKYIKTSMDAGFGVQPSRGKEKTTTVPLEKLSDVRSGQADWLKQSSNIDPRIQNWIKTSNLDHNKYTYLLVVPVGADESWEETVNGDAFERSELKPENSEWGHKTFELFAKAYKHHRNKDPELGYGDHPLMVYNDEMDRCEGVWRLDNEKANQVGAGDVIEKVLQGKKLEISMGCRVKYDRCSLCGNEAKSPREYCQHVYRPGFGHVDPVTGAKMRVFNPKPKFFDLSAVVIPAAPEAAVLGHLFPELASHIKNMEKVSSSSALIIPSAYMGAALWGADSSLYEFQKASSPRIVKMSDLIKEAPVLEMGVIRPMQDSEEELDSDILKKAGVEGAPFQEVLSTLASLGIVLSPQEFMRTAGMCFDEPSYSRAVPSLSDISSVFDFADDSLHLLAPEAYNPAMAHKMKHLVPERSMLFPFLGQRIIGSMEKKPTKTTKPSIRISVSLEGVPSPWLYASYIKTLSRKMGEILNRVIMTYPKHESQILAGGLLTSPSIKGSARSYEKLSELPAQALLPSAYILAMAGHGKNSHALQRSISELNAPGVEHLFGGVVYTRTA